MCNARTISVPQTELIRQPCKDFNVPGQILMSLHIFGIKLYMKNAYTVTFINMLHKKMKKKKKRKKKKKQKKK